MDSYTNPNAIRTVPSWHPAALLVGILLVARGSDARAQVPRAEPPAEAEGSAFYEQQVLPVLRGHCYECHAGEKVKGGLRLTSRMSLLQGGDSGPAVDLQNPGDSLLLQAVRYDGLEMPPSGKLDSAKVEILAKWVAQGAPWVAGAEAMPAAAAPVASSPQVTAEARNFWSFRPLARPPVPAVEEPAWSRQPIDAFVRARLAAAGLEPNPPAEKTVLLRRVYYDLVGLPPSPAEVRAFCADRSPDAFEKVVDRLLASPHYGERWARHWLDLVRYAETNSYERDNAKPQVWRYRDYVIRSFNDDKPYDQFLIEQLAGDELEPLTADRLIATGFYRLGIWDDEPTDEEQALYDDLDDVVGTTGQVFLGLTVNCARCHEHKLDPIPQRDYYRLLAFFAGVTRYGERSPESIAAHSLRSIAVAEEPGKLAEVLCVTETGAQPRATRVLIRGNPHAPGELVEPGFLSVLNLPDPVLPPPPANGATSGRRLVLARWLAQAENPLTARVMANRIWQYHFGRGIVRSPNNFGFAGDPPTHPELLDWLACELIAGGWRLKPLHKQILLSQAYRMSSVARPAALERDPANDLLWRFERRRLEAEEIRDSILAVHGGLVRTLYGPSVFPVIEPEVLAGQSRPGSGWGDSSPQDRSRRSVYIHVKRSLLLPLLATFDASDVDASCPVRFATTQPTQALGLLNSRLLQEESLRFAAALRRDVGPEPADEAREAWWRVTQRAPTDAEVQRGADFISDVRRRHGLTDEEALRQFCLLALNLNEFLYLD